MQARITDGLGNTKSTQIAWIILGGGVREGLHNEPVKFTDGASERGREV